ncbi:MAG: ABC transporter permease [Planctomycetes bacterium]|nr:ABC transporter permease [Planctomycetota bacterium]
MSIFETLRTAMRALLSNKMRSVLTMLGVVIGVGAVVAMLALGEGTKADIEKNIRSLGSDVLTVRPGQAQMGQVRGGNVETLKVEDAEAVGELPGILQVAPSAQASAQIKFLSNNVSASVVGVTPEYFEVQKLVTQYGAPFSETQVRGRRRVAVLGSNVAMKLFPGSEPLNQRVKIRGLSFQIVGVLAGKGEGFSSPDDQVLVPLLTHQTVLFGRDYITTMTIQVENENDLDNTKLEIEGLLRSRHRLRPEEASDFNISSTKDVLATVGQITGMLTAFLAALAAISLLVGGIGIMNIMLVSVRERTREIGIRMAIGARRGDVLLQFLIEAVVVSLLGGVIGLGVGAGIAFTLSKVAGTGFVLPLYAVALSLGVSLATGVGFGVWPARSASRLDPVEALRYE